MGGLTSLNLGFCICKMGEEPAHLAWRPFSSPPSKEMGGGWPNVTPSFVTFIYFSSITMQGMENHAALQPRWADSHSILGWGPGELPATLTGARGKAGPWQQEKERVRVESPLCLSLSHASGMCLRSTLWWCRGPWQPAPSWLPSRCLPGSPSFCLPLHTPQELLL